MGQTVLLNTTYFELMAFWPLECLRSLFSLRSERHICIACGERVARSDAREYDKHGDRWEREGKSFEYICQDCHRNLNHHSLNGIEETASDVSVSHHNPWRFARAYVREDKRRKENKR